MQTSNILTIIFSSFAVVISLLSLFGFHDLLFHPSLELEIEGGDRGNNTSLFFFNINNTGTAPATNVVVTINSDTDVIGSAIHFSTEHPDLKIRGSKSVVVDIPRLTNNDFISINTAQNSSIENNHFMIYISYAQGSTKYFDTKNMKLNLLTDSTHEIHSKQIG